MQPGRREDAPPPRPMLSVNKISEKFKLELKARDPPNFPSPKKMEASGYIANFGSG